MKKLYRKGQVHPSPTPTNTPSQTQTQTTSNHNNNNNNNNDQFCLNYLPAAILTLAASLSFEDKQVLSYLLSCSSNTPFDFNPSKSSKKHLTNINNNNIIISNNNNNNNNINQQHSPSFCCYCFTCYTSYWARWDSSPNRQLIHEIIDAFEDNLLAQRKKKQGLSRKEKRKNNKSNIIINNNNNNKGSSLDNDYDGNTNVSNQHLNVDANGSNGSGRVSPDSGRVDPVEEEEEEDDETGEKQGSVRKIVSFIGERIWGSVWG